MTVDLTPELERLLDEQLASGAFESREALVLHALGLLLSAKGKAHPPLSGEERAKQLEAFFKEIDGEPPSEAGPLPDEALSRETFYDTERTRV
jgi:Arc/MetJ-type ribon-helix-helix transcriptional regulator